MVAALHDPALLALAFTVSVFALTGALTLAGIVRIVIRARGRIMHWLTLGAGGIALGTLGAVAFGLDPDPASPIGLVAGVAAPLFWLIGAALARVRPAWVDVVVIVAGLAYFTVYAEIADRPGAVPPVFSGVTLPVLTNLP